jgi:TonB family protein
MKQSHLALVCGLVLVVILAMSWCGRKPAPEAITTPIPALTPSPISTAAPSATPAASATVAQTSPALPANQTPSPEFRKVADKVQPAVIQVTVFDQFGQLLRTGTGFFVSQDGEFATDSHVVEGGAHAVAKSSDGKIRNITGVLASSTSLDLALLKAETKTGVSFLPLKKAAELDTGTPVAVVGSSLAHREQPLTESRISGRRSDQGDERLEISGAIPSDADGSPVVDLNGDVVGVVTSSHEQNATTKVVRPATTVDLLTAQIKPGTTGRWAAAEPETPTPSPSPTAIARTDNRRLKVLYNPAPRYPGEARFAASPIRGSGRFRVIFAANGQVKNVETVTSTGRPVLDQAAFNALRQWKSEPGHEWTILVPISFEP